MTRLHFKEIASPRTKLPRTTEPNTSIGQCHPISASEDLRQDLEALQGSAACATGTHEPFPVTWHGGAASAESICRHAQNVSL